VEANTKNECIGGAEAFGILKEVSEAYAARGKKAVHVSFGGGKSAQEEALRSLYRALCEAKSVALENIQDYGALSASVPLLPAVMEETLKIFGENFWPYGMESNRKTLEKIVLYAE